VGLAIALELGLAGRKVAVVERDRPGQQASWAAAGMLAPRAERLPDGPLRELCLRSLALYPDWIAKLEQLAGRDTGYWLCGILLPWQGFPADSETLGTTLDRTALDARQPGLGPDMGSAIWLPQEGQVDNRQLVTALREALTQVGVAIVAQTDVQGWIVEGELIQGLQTSRGRLEAEVYVATLGAWSGQLLPIPVFPLKGQMLSVLDPACRLQHVIFGEAVYLVPRRDGHLLVGATEEAVGFTPGNTAGGLQRLLAAAIALYPAIADMTLQETWWGFRPTTPDLLPVLGRGPQRNLFVATGHHRNGILLAPITAQLLAQAILTDEADPLLAPFAWHRFPVPESPVLC
jgi:glycine oxidase ThiO